MSPCSINENVLSSIAMSTVVPRPVRSRATRAVRIPQYPMMPAVMSEIEVPTRVAGPSGHPVASMIPDSAWITVS